MWYAITEKLEKMGFLSIAAGTVHPILQKLERTGLIAGEMRASTEGPKRKNFTITLAGKTRLEEFLKDWDNLTAAMTHLIGEIN